MTGRGCRSYLVHKASDEREEIAGYWRYSVGRSKQILGGVTQVISERESEN